MKKLLSLFILVFAAAAFGQNDLSQNYKIDDIKGETNLPDLNKYAIKQTGDESVARVLDGEFARLGYSEPARLSILGDVGRENNWDRNIIFKGHSDPKKQRVQSRHHFVARPASTKARLVSQTRGPARSRR